MRRILNSAKKPDGFAFLRIGPPDVGLDVVGATQPAVVGLFVVNGIAVLLIRRIAHTRGQDVVVPAGGTFGPQQRISRAAVVAP